MIENILKELDNIKFSAEDIGNMAYIGQWGDADFFYYGISKAMEVVEKYLDKE